MERNCENMRKRERGIMYIFEKLLLTWGRKREREGERKTERLHPKQKRVKWVSVVYESDRVS